MNPTMVNIEDAYALSPLQQGMLFHSLRDAGVGMYISQAVSTLVDLDVDAYRQAWQHMVDRHAILRTSFHWQDRDEPQQRVHRNVPVRLVEKDWRNLPVNEQNVQLRRLMREERERSFELTEPSLLRVVLLRISRTRWYCVHSHHHILLDGWSGGILARELNVAYEALRRGGQVPLPPTRPYRHYVDWLEQQDLGKAESFWRAQLKGMTAPTPLPWDAGLLSQFKVRAHVGSWSAHIDPARSEGLRGLARACQITLNALIQGAWAIVLSRYAGSPDVLFGLLVSGRPPELEGVEDMVGMFLNTIPFRIGVSPEKPLNDWLKEVHARQVEIQSFEHSPLVMVQRWSEIPPGTPLFESILARKDVTRAGQAGRASRSSSDARSQQATFQQSSPLLLNIAATEDIEFKITFDARRFDTPDIARLMEQLTTLLAGMVEDPSRKVGELPMMPVHEHHRLVVEWNQTATVLPEQQSLGELFEAQVAHAPDAIAVRDGSEAISFKEVNGRANRLAHYLHSIGVKPGVRVAISVHTPIQLAVALMSVLKAGGTLVPIDRTLPKTVLKLILDDAKTTLILTEERGLERLPHEGSHFVCIDRDARVWANGSSANPQFKPEADTLACILYAAGASGVPRGVAVSHRAAVVRAGSDPCPWEGSAVLCVGHRFLLNDALWEVLAAWRHGAAVAVIHENPSQVAEEWIEAVCAMHAERVVLTLDWLRVLTNAEPELLGRLAGLKYWVIRGDPPPVEMCRRFSERLPAAILTNLFAMPEISAALVGGLHPATADYALLLGRPAPNARVYLVDGNLQPCPAGVAGELYVGTPGLADGYWGQTEATDQRFVPDPFAAPGSRLFRTGVRARWLPNGNVEYLGRLDNGLQAAGADIDLTDLESRLCGSSIVKDAALVMADEEHLLVYVAPYPPFHLVDTSAILRWLAIQCPGMALKPKVVSVKHIPKASDGTPDRARLIELFKRGAGLEGHRSGARKPATEMEVLIARIWAEVLRIDEVFADDNFFELGGHSLIATRVTARLTSALKRDVPLRAVFEAPTVEGLADWIQNAKHEEELPYAVQVANRGKEAPLSFTQQQLWILGQLFPHIPAYTIPSNLRFSGHLDMAALLAALRDLIDRHEILRTTFVAHNGEPLQVIHPTPDEIPVEIIDVSGLPQEDRIGAARMHGAQLGRHAWDLANGPLVRIQVVHLAPDEHVLNTAFHHIISDGPSNAVFCRELGKLYEARLSGQPAHLQPLPLQFADYAIWERENVKGRLFEKQAAYWKANLEGAALLEIPTDFPRPAVHGFKGKKVKFEVPKEITLKLREIGTQQRASIFMSLVAVFKMMLYRYSGQDDVLIGTAMTNRIRVELERLIGLFVNTVPLRTSFAGDPTFREVLTRVRDCCVGAFANMDLPFEETIRQFQPHRDLSRQGSPLFQFMLIHNPVGAGKKEGGPGFRPGDPHNDTGFSNFDVLLSTSETPDGEVKFTLVYDTELFKPATIDRLIGHLQALFSAVAAEPDSPISAISILTPEEERKILHEWSGTTAPIPTRCVHEAIVDIARRESDRQALVFENASLTYGELNRQANYVASRLKAAGVGPEKLVALCLPRGLNMIVALFGILKAGGAFVPMDPTYPLERLRYLVRDAKCSAIVCEPSLEDALATEAAPVVTLDPARDGCLPACDDEPACGAGLRNIAYVVYTSGSTGAPKGVLVEHAGLAHTIAGQLREFGIDGDDRVLQMLSLSFDAAIGEIFRALAAGAVLVLARKEDLLPGPGLVDIMRRNAISVTAMTPTALAAMPDVSARLTDLHTLIVGGEACPAAVAEKWGRGRRLINGYGPTETTIGATVAVNWDFTQKPPLGHPLPNVRVYVLDRRMQPTPIGIPGELFIGGNGVARGYLGRPDLTAERFLPNPFAANPGERMYRTGDLVRWKADGTLDFLGRIDHQVKLRGFRIELGEIEAALMLHGDIAQCAVDVIKDTAGERLVAYITFNDGAQAEVKDLKAFLKERLPEYMVPSLFMVLPALPVNNSGKVDRKALPKPDFDSLAEKTEYVAPQTELEKLIAAIWMAVLGIKRVGLLDNFFALGGDSISSIRVVARALEHDIKLAPKDLFQYQTITDLVAAIEQRRVALPEM